MNPMSLEDQALDRRWFDTRDNALSWKLKQEKLRHLTDADVEVALSIQAGWFTKFYLMMLKDGDLE